METFSQYITKEDNDIIRIAAFIADKGFNGASCKELATLFHEINQLTCHELKELIKNEKFYTLSPGMDKTTHEKFRKLTDIFCNDNSSFDLKDDKIAITFEGVSSLLDFIELKHARQNSRDAKKYSLWAIGISALALILSAVIGIIQLNSSVKIEDGQLKEITKINYIENFDRLDKALVISNEIFNSIIVKLDSIDKHNIFLKKKK
jgi:hypothetical protein